MKRKLLSLLIIFLFILACNTSQGFVEKRCPSYVSKSIKGVKIDEFQFVLDNDTLHFNEVKFYCINNNSFYSRKVMFDKFGMWQNEIYPKNERHPILLWTNLQLFEKDTTRYSIAALGDENRETLYASFMAFDSNGKDVLNDSIQQNILVNYFENLIKNSKPRNTEFNEIYNLKSVNNNWKDQVKSL